MSTNLTPLTADKALNAYYLEARCKLLDIAAILDRISRGERADAIENDPRMALIQQALEAIHDEPTNRAEKIQQIFSLQYDPSWERPQPR